MLTIISLPEGVKDPDDLIQKSPKLWQQAIDTAQPIVDWILGQYSKREDLTTAAGKRGFTTAALGVVRTLQDVVEQEHYLPKIAEYTGSSIEVLRNKLASIDKPTAQTLRRVVAQTQAEQDTSSYQDNLLAAALIDGATHDLFRQVDLETFIGEERRAVAYYLAEHVRKSTQRYP